MTSLLDLQRSFQACVLGETGAPPATGTGIGTAPP